MNKTRRTLIISSVIMALAFVVAVVGVSAAWFGDMKSAREGGFIIQSDTLQDVASIDISSAEGMSGEKVLPAVAEKGYFLKNGINPPTGADLKTADPSNGVIKAAQIATIYFPIQFIGTPDGDFVTENRKSLQLKLLSANVDGGDGFDFLDEFNVETCLVNPYLDADGKLDPDGANDPLATTDEYQPLTGSNVFYVMHEKDLYMLVQPGITYWVRVRIYFNKIDEECNPDLLGTVIKFNFKLNVLTDGHIIRDALYAVGGGANE